MHENTVDLLEQNYHRSTCRFCFERSTLFMCDFNKLWSLIIWVKKCFLENPDVPQSLHGFLSSIKTRVISEFHYIKTKAVLLYIFESNCHNNRKLPEFLRPLRTWGERCSEEKSSLSTVLISLVRQTASILCAIGWNTLGILS